MRKHGEVAAPQHRSSGSKRARDNDSESESEEEDSRQQRRTSSNTARNRHSNESEDESGQEEEEYSGSEAEETGKSAGKKADRNAPVELRINRPVSRFQHVVQVKKPVRKGAHKRWVKLLFVLACWLATSKLTFVAFQSVACRSTVRVLRRQFQRRYV